MGRKALFLKVKCPYCVKNGVVGIVRSKGYSGTVSRKVQRFNCLKCGKSFSDSINTPFFRLRKDTTLYEKALKTIFWNEGYKDPYRKSWRGLAKELGVSRGTLKHWWEDVTNSRLEFEYLAKVCKIYDRRWSYHRTPKSHAVFKEIKTHQC